MKARFYYTVAAAVAAMLVSVPAVAAHSRSPFVLALRKAKPVHTATWRKHGLNASVPLIYASLVTSLSTGETNVYQQSGSTLSLVGQLSEGGGPIATDSRGDVVVADVGGNALGIVARNVYVYRAGATAPSYVLADPNYCAEVIAATTSAVYVSGQSVANSGTSYGIMEYRLPSSIPSPAPSATPQTITGTLLPAAPAQPAEATGLAVDSSENLFVGWSPIGLSSCQLSALSGCGQELPVTGPPWKTYLPLGQGENFMTVGPVLTDGESQTIVSASGDFQYLVTFPKGSYIPSQVVTLPTTGPVTGIDSLVVDSGGAALWVANDLISGGTSFKIWKLSYPSGAVSLTYTIPQGSYSLAIPLNNALAVSPEYAP